MTKKIIIRKIAFVTIITLTLALIGCRSVPVLNINEHPISVSDTTSAKNVKQVIMLAGASLGWSMKEAKPGHIVGTLHLRKHMAIIDIPYSTNSYSILYKNSAQLGYDGNNIHSNYNGWITNLNNAIQQRLMTL